MSQSSILPEENSEVRLLLGEAPPAAHSHHMVVGVPVRPLQPCARGELVDDHMDVAPLAVVRVAPVVDHRGGGEAAPSAQDPPGVERPPRRPGVGPVPLGHMVQVRVESADLPVEREELPGRDLPAVQHGEPVLHPPVVEGPGGEAGGWVRPVDVHGVVVDRGPDPLGPGRAVAHLLECRHPHLGALGLRRRALLMRRVDPRGSGAQVRDAPPGPEPGDEPLLFGREPSGGDVREVVVEEPGIGEREDRRRCHVGEARGDDDAVEDAGVVVGGLVALVGAAGAPGADRVDRFAVRLDEPLLHHDVRLRREEVVAVVAEDVERSRGDGVSHPEESLVEDDAGSGALAEPPAPAPAAVRVDELPVPSRARRPGVGRGVGGVVEDRALVDGPVDRAGLHPDDDRNGLPVERRGPGHVGRPGRVGPEPAVGGREVDMVHAGLDGAVLVEGGSEERARREFELLGLAEEGRLVRSRDDRSLDPMVRDGERGRRAAGKARLQGVRARAETLHEADEPSASLRGPEAVRDVRSVRRDLDVPGRHPASEIHADQNVASGNQVRARAEALDPDGHGFGDLRSGGAAGEDQCDARERCAAGEAGT